MAKKNPAKSGASNNHVSPGETKQMTELDPPFQGQPILADFL
jgi:hypothetical protein